MKTRIILLALSILFIGFVADACKKDENKSIDLQSGDWKVIKLKNPRSNDYSETRNEYILSFKTDTTYGIGLDVNQCGGSYEIKGSGTINISTPACTRVCCDSDFANNLIQLLPDMTQYFERGKELVLEGNGEIVLEKK